MALRPELFREFTTTITSTNCFKAADFQFLTTAEKNSNAVKLTVKYLSDGDIYFVSILPSSRTKESADRFASSSHVIDTTYSPGEVNNVESARLYGKEELISSFKNWLLRIREDILAGPVYRHIQEQQRQIEDLYAQIENNLGDGYFSAAEAEDLQSKVDDLERRLAEQLTALGMSKQDLEKRLSELEREFETARTELQSLKKKSWTKSFLGKIVSWASNPTNAKLLTSTAEAAKVVFPLLTGGNTKE